MVTLKRSGKGLGGGELGEEKEKRFGKTLLEGCRVKAFLSYVTVFLMSVSLINGNREMNISST